MTLNILDISKIRFGFYAQSLPKGDISFLQVRQFNDHGNLISQPDEFINLDNKNESHLLQDGDVLFVGKGNRLFAWCYRNVEGPVVASSIFFVLRPNQHLIYPEYLSAILNAPQSKTAFQKIGSGTNIFSIRKSELGAFQVPILPMEQQKKVASLAKLHQQQIALSQDLITQLQNLYSAIISKLINT